jgi:aspartate/methionine/tyrosine aminotransferase
MSGFQPFVMERMMSKFEQEVEFNLSESGVHPILLGDLLKEDPDSLEDLLETDLNYPHVNGTPALRAHIAALYTGMTPKNVLVTVGAIEANYITTRALLSPGDEIAIMMPNYMQIWGIAKNHEYRINTFHLQESAGWALDLDQLNKAVTPQTRLIAVCNPNNPTGYILSDAEMTAICAAADRVGAWILADEVYRGAERLTDQETPSFVGRYERVIATGSMSKAYGMPGLRLGWAVGTTDLIDEIWARHEYVTISAAMLANKLAALALSPEVRPRLLRRTRSYIRKGFPILEKWIADHGETFRLTAPQAAAIAFVWYQLDINSTLLATRLQKEKSVLIVPGDHFGMDHYLRISFGLPPHILVPALERVQQLIKELQDV